MSFLEIIDNLDNLYNVLALKICYDKIFDEITEKDGIISFNNYKFNNHIGDITKNIYWTWAINNESLKLFDNCILNMMPEINKFFNNNFKLFGASFITLYNKEILDCESDYHIDVISHYDTEDTNILTLIFPLYIDEDMGGLEYMENNEIKIYKYNHKSVFIWDSCKLNHRTQPYNLLCKKKRVLVSMNLVSETDWALKSISKTLKYQGNIE